MSLKDLLPPDTYEELQAEVPASTKDKSAQDAATTSTDGTIMVRCPTCHKMVPYSSSNPFRPFCSERCKLIDLGAWASDERALPGESISQEDAYMLEQEQERKNFPRS